MYYVYILRCSDNTFYTGITTDVQRRVMQHNRELPGGAKYTAARNPVEVVYSAKFKDRSSAGKEEWRIKHMKRNEKELLINKNS